MFFFLSQDYSDIPISKSAASLEDLDALNHRVPFGLESLFQPIIVVKFSRGLKCLSVKKQNVVVALCNPRDS